MVSIIILNYNGKKYLKDCFNSVLAQSFNDFEIILVDNASTDGSIDFMKENFIDERIKIYSTNVNIGFAGGNNFGLRYAKGKYIVLLNNDTFVEKDWLRYLVETIELDEQIAIVQSLVYTEGIPEKYYIKNGTINLFGHNIMEIFDINENGIGEIIQSNGCSLVVRKDFLDDTGGLFLNEYFLYAEDTYLSFKAKFKGFKILHNSKSVVHHKGSGTTKNQIPSEIYFYQERNRLLNFFLFFDSSFIVRYIPLFIANYKLKFFYCLFSKRYSLKGLIRSYFWFLGNVGWIKKQRKEIRKFKTEQDNDVLKYISCKFFNGNNLFEKTVNLFSLIYCKLTGLRVLENAE